ncbi:MAG: hypothetical protein M3P18_13930 [Actinomycetota bacterium]|nr:hypothetical protein [Actinomycetota bacterium]
MSQNTPGKADHGPGSGAAKPVTEPPGGALDRALNEIPDQSDVEDGSEEEPEPS